MTDEELAEEYTKGNCIRWECDSLSVDDIAKENFLAGFEAGRPKWHKVADGDLPPENTEVLNDDGVKVILIHGHWRYFYGAEWEDDAHVCHWCEIPEFKEE